MSARGTRAAASTASQPATSASSAARIVRPTRTTPTIIPFGMPGGSRDISASAAALPPASLSPASAHLPPPLWPTWISSSVPSCALRKSVSRVSSVFSPRISSDAYGCCSVRHDRATRGAGAGRSGSGRGGARNHRRRRRAPRRIDLAARRRRGGRRRRRRRCRRRQRRSAVGGERSERQRARRRWRGVLLGIHGVHDQNCATRGFGGVERLPQDLYLLTCVGERLREAVAAHTMGRPTTKGAAASNFGRLRLRPSPAPAEWNARYRGELTIFDSSAGR